MDSITDNSLRTLWGIVKTAGTPDYLKDGTLIGEKRRRHCQTPPSRTP
jgi:hypothetical protein